MTLARPYGVAADDEGDLSRSPVAVRRRVGKVRSLTERTEDTVDGPIVVGTDGSETATSAVMEAVRLAGALDRALHIVSAYRPLPREASELPAELRDSLTWSSAVEAVLEDAAARARVGGVIAETHARVGDGAAVLLDLAEELGASMLVVGNKGIGSAKRFVLGNVPSKVVHHAPCSTLVVHTT